LNQIGIAGWIFQRSIRLDKTMTLLDLPPVSAELGATSIELVSTFFESQHANYLNQLRGVIEKANLEVRSIAVDQGNIANSDSAVRRTDIEALKQWFHVAKAVGSKAIRINSGPGRPDDAAVIDRIVDGYRDLAGDAAHTGIYLLIENHGGASADPKNIQAFLDRVDSPWFLTCPDTGNFTNDTWEEGMRIMAPLAFSARVKAYTYSPNGEQRWGRSDGEARAYDLKRSLQILKDARYAGPIMVEGGAGEIEHDNARDAMAYVRELWAGLA
jgi:sugar phosphate isomerase/epimerase